MRKAYLLLVVFTLGYMSFCIAQDSTKIKPVVPRKHFTFYFSPLGFQLTNLQALNQTLQSKAYAPLTESQHFYNAGFVFRYPGKMLIYSDITYGNVPNNKNAQKTAAQLYGLNLGFGYEAIRHAVWSAFPYLGVGSNSLLISATKQDIPATQFNDYLGSPPDQIQFSVASTNLKMGWQFNRFVTIGRQPIQKMVLSLNVGYSAPLRTRFAQRNGRPLADAPQVNIGGFYGKIMLGF